MLEEELDLTLAPEALVTKTHGRGHGPAGDAVAVVECLGGLCEALDSIPRTTTSSKTKNKNAFME